jgi:AraC-like DNA-binding protein
MSLLGKFIESIQVRVSNAGFREVVQPLFFSGSIPESNMLLHVNKGKMTAGMGHKTIPADESFFIPQGQNAIMKLGKMNKNHLLAVSGFNNVDHRREYLNDLSGLKSWDNKNEILTVISFELLLYNAFPFFPLLNMPAFPLPNDKEFSYLVYHLALENEQQKLGKNIIMNNYMQEIVIHLFRYIESQSELVKHIDKLHYLTDKRLVEIINYIHKNLHKDLSNKAIAEIAFVSEDYVGQFFKSLTNMNLQVYIENQRLERAMQLLRTLPDSILAIAAMVGFKDPAYFSRRFRLKYGMNANEVKKTKESSFDVH